MGTGSKLKLILVCILAVVSTILSIVCWLIPDPVPFIEEVGLTGVSGYLWKSFSKALSLTKGSNLPTKK